MFLSLYGEVQKEVIQETLATDFGVEVEFRETSPICIERRSAWARRWSTRPIRSSRRSACASSRLPLAQAWTFPAGGRVRLDAALVHKAVEESVHETLRQGLSGWRVTDCLVAMTEGIRYRHWATSTPAEHRHLTPLVLMSALKRAGTGVHEPMHHFHLEFPEDALGPLSSLLARLGAVPESSGMQGAASVLEGAIPAARIRALQQALPPLTRGEGLLETAFSHYRPAPAPFPTRPRSDLNPLDRKQYLLNLKS